MKEQSPTGLIINWNKGERAYQIHSFENAEGSVSIQVSSKIDSKGKIYVFIRGLNTFNQTNGITAKPSNKQEFDDFIDLFKKNLERSGFVHHFIDLNHCKDWKEASQLLTKSNSDFKFKIKEN